MVGSDAPRIESERLSVEFKDFVNTWYEEALLLPLIITSILSPHQFKSFFFFSLTNRRKEAAKIQSSATTPANQDPLGERGRRGRLRRTLHQRDEVVRLRQIRSRFLFIHS